MATWALLQFGLCSEGTVEGPRWWVCPCTFGWCEVTGEGRDVARICTGKLGSAGAERGGCVGWKGRQTGRWPDAGLGQKRQRCSSCGWKDQYLDQEGLGENRWIQTAPNWWRDQPWGAELTFCGSLLTSGHMEMLLKVYTACNPDPQWLLLTGTLVFLATLGAGLTPYCLAAGGLCLHGKAPQRCPLL